MILSDTDIEKRLSEGLVHDWGGRACLNPASLDVRLSGAYKGIRGHNIIDPFALSEVTYSDRSVPIGESTIIYPGAFMLGSTLESFAIPDDLVGILSGKSSLGRLGLQIHATAGFIDPGFRGQVTLELSNVGPAPIRLWTGMRIGQVSFTNLSSPAECPYGSEGLGSHYQGQMGPTESRFQK